MRRRRRGGRAPAALPDAAADPAAPPAHPPCSALRGRAAVAAVFAVELLLIPYADAGVPLAVIVSESYHSTGAYELLVDFFTQRWASESLEVEPRAVTLPPHEPQWRYELQGAVEQWGRRAPLWRPSMVIGPPTSVQAEAFLSAGAASAINGTPATDIPTLSQSATSSELTSDRMRFPRFASALPSDADLAAAFAAILESMGLWSVSVVYTKDAYGLGFWHSFRDTWVGGLRHLLAHSDLGGCVSPRLCSPERLRAELLRVKNGGASVIIVASGAESATLEALRDAAAESGMLTPRYVWLAVDLDRQLQWPHLLRVSHSIEAVNAMQLPGAAEAAAGGELAAHAHLADALLLAAAALKAAGPNHADGEILMQRLLEASTNGVSGGLKLDPATGTGVAMAGYAVDEWDGVSQQHTIGKASYSADGGWTVSISVPWLRPESGSLTVVPVGFIRRCNPCTATVLFDKMDLQVVDWASREALHRINLTFNVLLKDNPSQSEVHSYLREFAGVTSSTARGFDICQEEGVVAHDNHTVVASIGPSSSSLVRTTGPDADSLGVPVISYSSTDPKLENVMGYSTTIRVIPNDKYQARAIVDLCQWYDWRHVNIVGTNDEYGGGLVRMFKEYNNYAYGSDSYVYITHEITFSEDLSVAQSKYDDALDRVLRGGTKVILFLGQWQPLVRFMLTARKAGDIVGKAGWALVMSENLLAASHQSINELATSLGMFGTAHSGAELFNDLIQGMVLMNPGMDPASKATRDWQSEYQVRPVDVDHGSQCISSVVENYMTFKIDAFGLIIHALETMKAQQGGRLTSVSKMRLLAVMRQTKFKGISGEIDLTYAEAGRSVDANSSGFPFTVVNFVGDPMKGFCFSRAGLYFPKNPKAKRFMGDDASDVMSVVWPGGVTSAPTDGQFRGSFLSKAEFFTALLIVCIITLVQVVVLRYHGALSRKPQFVSFDIRSRRASQEPTAEKPKEFLHWLIVLRRTEARSLDDQRRFALIQRSKAVDPQATISFLPLNDSRLDSVSTQRKIQRVLCNGGRLRRGLSDVYRIDKVTVKRRGRPPDDVLFEEPAKLEKLLKGIPELPPDDTIKFTVQFELNLGTLKRLMLCGMHLWVILDFGVDGVNLYTYLYHLRVAGENLPKWNRYSVPAFSSMVLSLITEVVRISKGIHYVLRRKHNLTNQSIKLQILAQFPVFNAMLTMTMATPFLLKMQKREMLFRALFLLLEDIPQWFIAAALALHSVADIWMLFSTMMGSVAILGTVAVIAIDVVDWYEQSKEKKLQKREAQGVEEEEEEDLLSPLLQMRSSFAATKVLGLPSNDKATQTMSLTHGRYNSGPLRSPAVQRMRCVLHRQPTAGRNVSSLETDNDLSDPDSPELAHRESSRKVSTQLSYNSSPKSVDQLTAHHLPVTPSPSLQLLSLTPLASTKSPRPQPRDDTGGSPTVTRTMPQRSTSLMQHPLHPPSRRIQSQMGRHPRDNSDVVMGLV